MTVITVGLDVSAERLDAAATAGQRQRVANTPAGHSRLLAWLQQLGGPTQVSVGLEATGTYHRPVALALAVAGYAVRVCNPLQVARYSQALLARTKTDAVDAGTLAQFCARHAELPLWQPPTLEQERLQVLVRTRALLLEQVQQLRNRQHAASYTAHAALVAALQAPILAALDQQVARIEQELTHLQQAATTLGQQLRWVQSIPGVGLVTAAVLLAEIPLERLTDAKQVAAYTGLCPRQRQSGSSVHGQRGVGGYGPAALRRALFLPALTALRWNPVLHAFGERLRARGKPKRVIAVAAMRKLVELAWTLVHSQQPFDPQQAFSPSGAANP